MSKTSRKQTLYHSCKITTSKNCCFYCISKNTANCLVNSQWCRQPRIPVTVEVALEATVEVSFKFISSEWNHLHNHLKYLLKIVIISCKMGIQYQKRPKYITTFSSTYPCVSVRPLCPCFSPTGCCVDLFFSCKYHHQLSFPNTVLSWLYFTRTHLILFLSRTQLWVTVTSSQSTFVTYTRL